MSAEQLSAADLSSALQQLATVPSFAAKNQHLSPTASDRKILFLRLMHIHINFTYGVGCRMCHSRKAYVS